MVSFTGYRPSFLAFLLSRNNVAEGLYISIIAPNSQHKVSNKEKESKTKGKYFCSNTLFNKPFCNKMKQKEKIEL